MRGRKKERRNNKDERYQHTYTYEHKQEHEHYINLFLEVQGQKDCKFDDRLWNSTQFLSNFNRYNDIHVFLD